MRANGCGIGVLGGGDNRGELTFGITLCENRHLRNLKLWKEGHQGIMKVMERSALQDLS